MQPYEILTNTFLQAIERNNSVRHDFTTNVGASPECEWYAQLSVQDDIDLDDHNPHRSHAQRFETEPLEEEMMKPAPTYIESNQDLTEALKKLTTRNPSTRYSLDQLDTPRRSEERAWSWLDGDGSETGRRQLSQARDRTSVGNR